MKKYRLGFFTTSGIISAIFTALIIGGFAIASGGMIFSPGSLNAGNGVSRGGVSSGIQASPVILGGVSSHAEIGGQCSLCHAAFWSSTSMADKCVACHADISDQWQDDATLHGAIRLNNPGFTCRNCHPDHRGPDAPLTDLSKARFPHDTFGFSLRGHPEGAEGSDITCGDCHADDYQNFNQENCATCHSQGDPSFIQEHDRAYGNDCLACHDGDDRFGSHFDHDRFTFELTGKHAAVDCTDCHTEPRKVGDFRSAPLDCSTCHAAVEPHQGRFGKDCAACHTSEGWSPAKFDHNLSTFKLDGRHENAKCESCHLDQTFAGTPADCYSCHKNQDPHAGTSGTNCAACHTTSGWEPATYNHGLSAFTLTGKHATTTCGKCHTNNIYKGTPSGCYACHQKEDAHGGKFGTNCASCHNTIAWKPATYDHNLASFKLTGAHASTACANCHVNGVFKGTSSSCNSCHQKEDAHGGKFGTNCASCHNTSAWKPATFDHNQASFKLTGAHASTTCANCHANGVYKGTPSDCNSCHKNVDAHGGKFGTNCASCRTTSAWKPATFDHNLSSFKLTGAHTSTACANCHANGVYKGTPSDCNSCHKNVDTHGGKYGTNCASCHTTSAWKPATFDHNLASFKLTGAHASTACANCHANGVYKGTPSDCNSCHKNVDAHGGRFGTNCGSCHTTSAWKPATFDHNLASFKLTGAHASTACANCHANGVYKGTPSDCNSCHKNMDAHGGKFGTNCASCHTTSAWKPATFDHNLSGFPLTGAHSSLACSRCHTNGGYTGLSRACVSCHAEPAYHAGLFGTDCASCHSTSAWRPATYNGSHSFPLNHGGGADCQTCHPSGYTSYTCYNCHEHNQSEIEKKHKEEGIDNFQDCTSCHPNGDKD